MLTQCTPDKRLASIPYSSLFRSWVLIARRGTFCKFIGELSKTARKRKLSHTEPKTEELADAHPMHNRQAPCFQFIFMMPLTLGADSKARYLLQIHRRALKDRSKTQAEPHRAKNRRTRRCSPNAHPTSDLLPFPTRRSSDLGC